MARWSRAELERQLRAPNPGRMDGRFAVRTGVPERLAAGLTGARSEALRGDRRRAAAARPAAGLDGAERHAEPAGGARAGACLPASRRRTPRMCWAGRRTGTRPPPGSAPSCSPASATAAASRSRATPEAIVGAGADRADAAIGGSHPRDRLCRGRAGRRRHRRACAGAARRRRAATASRGCQRRARPPGDRPRRLGAAALCRPAAAGRQPLRRARGYRCRQCARRRRRPGQGVGRGAGQPAEGRAVPRGGGRDILRISPTRRRRSPRPRRACAQLLPGGRRAAGTDTAEIEVSAATSSTSTVEGQRMFIEARVVAVAGRPPAYRGVVGPSGPRISRQAACK